MGDLVASGFVVRENQYYDSVFLMSVGKRISDTAGVRQNAVLMGTDANKKVLSELGVEDQAIDAAGPNDLIVAVISDSQEIVDQVLRDLDDYLKGGIQAQATSNPHSLTEALLVNPNANLTVISVPGEYAAREASHAIDAGLNVFLFSDNVTIEDEVRLKKNASENGLIVMGPDCGTSLIGGIGIGFANAVRRGPIGAIAASGTGLQEFTCLVHNAGSGISHAIGTGGRDLSDRVGGISTLDALSALESDPATKIIALISKPPGARTLDRLLRRLESCSKPVIGCFLGAQVDEAELSTHLRRVSTIDEAAQAAVRLAGIEFNRFLEIPGRNGSESIPLQKPGWSSSQKFLRGIFAGGTFCYQSQQILRDRGISVYSNAPLDPDKKLGDPDHSIEHTLVDMGSDEFTSGRPHPMIDGLWRCKRVLSESLDPQTAVILVDFILGYNSSENPVGDVIEAIAEAKENVKKENGHLTVVASLCGTDNDPQDLDQQVRLLQEQGVIVFFSNAGAAFYCADLLGQSGGNYA